MKSGDPGEILKLHQSSRDLLVVVVSALLLLVILQFPYRFWILRTLIIGFNIFIVLGYSIISFSSLGFQEKGLFWRLILSVLVSLLIIISLGYLPLDNHGILRLSAMISIIAGVLAYARRHRRQKMIRRSLKEAGIDEKNIISPSEAAKIAIERHERISMGDEFERAFPSEDYFKIEEEKEKPKIGSYTDLILILIFTIITMISPIKWPLGIFMITLIPGYLLITILAPKKEAINSYERLFLSFAGSIIISAIISLILEKPLNLALTEMSCKFSILLTIASMMIRSRIKPIERFYWNPIKSIEKIKDTSLDKDKIISLILVFILISMIGATINIILNPVPSEKFTEFYILGPAGKAYDYPTDLKLGETGEVIIGVVNHEYQTMNCRIVIKLGEKTIGNTTLTLKNGEKWEKRFEFTPTEAGDDQKLQFLLYRLPDEKRVYRSLHLFINVKG
ncbi:MAG: DUF1616 domain-containing protein [Methanothermobacter sp.]|nr:DUF1616 domain-containing protein [Methanothermobacter sp.]